MAGKVLPYKNLDEANTLARSILPPALLARWEQVTPSARLAILQFTQARHETKKQHDEALLQMFLPAMVGPTADTSPENLRKLAAVQAKVDAVTARVERRTEKPAPGSEDAYTAEVAQVLTDKLNFKCSNCSTTRNAALHMEKEAKKCSRCRSAMYCNTECQIADWPKHKLSCKKAPVEETPAEAASTDETPAPSASAAPAATETCDRPGCGKTAADVTKDKLDKCGRCRIAKYCSRDCQRAHWPAHKPVCVAQAAGAGSASKA